MTNFKSMRRGKYVLLLMGMSLMALSCNRGAGCPAEEHARKMVNVSDTKNASFGGKKVSKAPKSSVLPAEQRYKGKK